MQLNGLPTVSVLTITYNCADYLEASYRMLCEQSFQNFEWVVVDDGSTDSTEDTVRSFDDPRINYFKSKVNYGRGFARNLGVMLAKSDLICIWDADDYHTKNRLDVAYKLFSDGVECSFSPVYILSESMSVDGVRYGEEFSLLGKKTIFPVHPSMNVSRKLLLEFPYSVYRSKGGAGEDYYPVYMIGINKKCFQILKPNVYYNECREINREKSINSNVSQLSTLLEIFFYKKIKLDGKLYVVINIFRTLIKLFFLKFIFRSEKSIFLLRKYRKKIIIRDGETIEKFSNLFK